MSDTLFKWVNKKELPDDRCKNYCIRLITDAVIDNISRKYTECYCDEAGWTEYHIFDFEWLKEIKQPPTNKAAFNIRYKWGKIIASKLYGGKEAKFTPVELQEILDDIESLIKQPIEEDKILGGMPKLNEPLITEEEFQEYIKESREADNLKEENENLKNQLREAHASRVMNEEGLMELNRNIKEIKVDKAIEQIDEQIKIYDKKSEEKQTDLNSPDFYRGIASGLNNAKLILERLK